MRKVLWIVFTLVLVRSAAGQAPAPAPALSLKGVTDTPFSCGRRGGFRWVSGRILQLRNSTRTLETHKCW
jgi:hypothetical protein